MAIKYHNKAKLLFAKTQVDENTPQTVFADTDAIAIFDADFNTQLDSETFQYTGSELDRDEGVTVKDKYAEMSGSTFVPALSDIATATAASDSNFPLARLFYSAGGNITYGAGVDTDATDGTADDQTVVISNSTAVDPSKAFLTLDIINESSQDATEANLFKLYGCRANVDLDLQIGARAKMKWAWKGSTYDSVAGHTTDYPMVITKRAADYGVQKTQILDAIRKSTITLAELQELGTAFTGGTTKNISFSKLTANNLFGFEYGRFLSADEEGFDKGAVGTDVVLTVLAPKADATWVPEKMLEKFFHFQFAWGLTKGKKCKIEFDKLQAMNIANESVGNYQGKAITFRNTGTVTITLS